MIFIAAINVLKTPGYVLVMYSKIFGEVVVVVAGAVSSDPENIYQQRKRVTVHVTCPVQQYTGSHGGHAA
jgi:hypothetical protein